MQFFGLPEKFIIFRICIENNVHYVFFILTTYLGEKEMNVYITACYVFMSVSLIPVSFCLFLSMYLSVCLSYSLSLSFTVSVFHCLSVYLSSYYLSYSHLFSSSFVYLLLLSLLIAYQFLSIL